MSKPLPRHDRGPGRVGDFFRALGAAIVLAALLVGMPLALWTLIGWPLPHAVPTIDEVRDTLTGPGFAVPDEAIVKTLAVLAWLYWAHFLVCVLVELAAAVRGRVAGGVPLGGVNQEVASRLVAAVLVLMPGQGALGVAAAALPLQSGIERPIAVAAPLVPGPDGGAVRPAREAAHGGPDVLVAGARPGAAVDRADASRPAGKHYVVKRGDNLWDIAGAHLPREGAKASANGTVECDPFRWREIYELNRDKRQPDGRRLLDEDLIQPGWVLTMPADAIGLPDEAPRKPAAPRPTAPTEAEPEPGASGGAATSSTVAPTTTSPPETTRPPATTATPSTSTAAPLPGAVNPIFPSLPTTGGEAGLGDDAYDPDVVPPRDRGATSTTARPGERGGAVAPIFPGALPGGPTGDPNGGGPGGPPRTQAPETSRPAPTTVPDRVTDPTRAPAGTQADPAGAPRAASRERPARGWYASLPWIAGGGLLAAGVLAALMRLRRAQQRRRPTGWRTPPPTPMEAETELDMRAAELPELAEFLDLALRAMAAGIARDGLPAPHVLGVIAGTDALQVLLAEPSPGTPAPFETTLSRRRWTLPLTTSLAELEQLGRDIASPLPALVTIGVADQGHVLVNLESFGLVALAGDLAASRALLNAVAIEFATSSWTDFVEVYMVGFGQELAGLERIRVAGSLEEVLPRLEEQAREVSRVLDETGHDSLLAGRVDGVAADSWVPAVVLCAEPPSAAAQRRLEALTADPARSPIVAVAIAMGDDSELAGPGWTFTVPADPEDPMRVPPLNLEVEPLRLDEANYTAIVELLRSSTGPAPAVPAAAPAAATPGAPEGAEASWFARPPGTGEHGLPEPGQPEPGSPEWTAAEAAGATTGNHAATPEAEGWVPAEWAPTDRSLRVPRNAARTLGAAGQGEGSDPLLAVDPPAGGQVGGPTEPAAIEVRVLGRVEIGGVGRIERGKSEELIVFLALNPEGVDSDRIADALWRGVPPAKATLNTTTTVARNSLGTTEDGSMRLPHARNGVYRLHSSVGLDWARFQALVARAETRGPAGADDLRAALDLVRGRPFEGVRPRTYGWALLDLAAVMESAVVDAADRLAELRLQAGDALGAQWAARCGLKLSPYDERLYRRLMLAADLAGNPAGVEAVMEELLKRLDDDSFEPWDALHDETRKLYDRLIGARQSGQQNLRRRA